MTFNTRKKRAAQPSGVGAGEGVAVGQAPVRLNLCMPAAVSVKTGPEMRLLASSAKSRKPADRSLQGVRAPQLLNTRLKKVTFEIV